jgi:hypothetical protein
MVKWPDVIGEARDKHQKESSLDRVVGQVNPQQRHACAHPGDNRSLESGEL